MMMMALVAFFVELINTQTVVEKGLCLDAFRACRQMENEAFFTINQCDHKTVDLIIESNR